jgi:hypothetical protein
VCVLDTAFYAEYRTGSRFLIRPASTEEAFSPQRVKREHPALQSMKFLDFFLLLWVLLALLDPDPDFESGYGSTDLINPDTIRIRNQNTYANMPFESVLLMYSINVEYATL